MLMWFCALLGFVAPHKTHPLCQKGWVVEVRKLHSRTLLAWFCPKRSPEPVDRRRVAESLSNMLESWRCSTPPEKHFFVVRTEPLLVFVCGPCPVCARLDLDVVLVLSLYVLRRRLRNIRRARRYVSSEPATISSNYVVAHQQQRRPLGRANIYFTSKIRGVFFCRLQIRVGNFSDSIHPSRKSGYNVRRGGP